MFLSAKPIDFFRGFASVYTTLEHHNFCFITLFSFKRDVNAKKKSNLYVQLAVAIL